MLPVPHLKTGNVTLIKKEENQLIQPKELISFSKKITIQLTNKIPALMMLIRI